MNKSDIKVRNFKSIDKIIELIEGHHYHTAVGLTLQGDKSFPIRLSVKVAKIVSNIDDVIKRNNFINELSKLQ